MRKRVTARTEDSMTTVVNLRYETCDVRIDRTSKWGNPFKIGRLTREQVVEKYRAYILARPELLAALPELRGKRLGCWCRPKEGFKGRLLCHGQILVELLEERSVPNGKTETETEEG